ncbi:hypothetical protein Pth03_44380 [Planotetraspora thailandica]|uniref:Uncharacterized protein n=2 Tax=Planotetraspora thailandica TaxID=487172 RepID=A0A8J3V1L2_9ACTN|nr:hypothetical protein Pth03_44380 [Planotetraspora thailandica]
MRERRSREAKAPVPQERESAPAIANASEATSSGSILPLTIPAALAAGLVLAFAYRRRHALVGGAVMRWRRLRLTREADRLLRFSQLTDTIALPAQQEATPREGVVSVPADAAAPDSSVLGEGRTSLGYVLAMSALHGMGLVGPGSDGVARAMVLELLAGRDFTARVLLPRDDAVRLFGEEAMYAETRGLVVLDTLQEVVTELEVEIVRRTGQRMGAGVPDGQPWLFVVASPGAAAERLHRIIQGGVEDLILGAFLGDWPYGITCTVDDTGLITSLEGRSAPAWTGHRLATCGQADAVQRFS